MIKLYCFGESGNAYKAALTLELAEEEWEPVYVDFFNGEARTPEFRELNIMGEVPVMVDGDLVLTQSGVIQDYISSKSGKLGGRSAAERRDVLRWMFFDNHKLSSVAGQVRYLMNFLPAEKRNADVIAHLQGRMLAALKTVDAQLEQTPYLTGDALTIADISCVSYLFYPEPFGFDRSEFPHIDAWMTRIEGTPGWKHPYDLMPGNPADRS